MNLGNDNYMDSPLCPRDNYRLEHVAGDYPTGVEMNGYHEYAHESGWFCAACNRHFSDEDIEVEDETDGGYFGYLADVNEHLRD